MNFKNKPHLLSLILLTALLWSVVISAAYAAPGPSAGINVKSYMSNMTSYHNSMNGKTTGSASDNQPDKMNPTYTFVDTKLGGNLDPGQMLNGVPNPGAFSVTDYGIYRTQPGNFNSRSYSGTDHASKMIKQISENNGKKFGDDVTAARAALAGEHSAQHHAAEGRPLQNAMQGQEAAAGMATEAADVAGEI